MRLAGWLASPIYVGLALAACAPVTGATSAGPPDPARFLKVNAAGRTVGLTLIAGYPGVPSEFNFDGYSDGALTVTIPTGWLVEVSCQNQGTVAHSCAITQGRALRPVAPSWAISDPQDGMQPRYSATFEFTPGRVGTYRIACLVGGHEDSGMWAGLRIVGSGSPSIKAGSGH